MAAVAAPLQVGDICYLNYGEAPPLFHARLILDVVDHAVEDYVVASPDYDIFTEQCSDQNADLVSFHRSGPGGIPPVGVPVGAVYGFAPMTAQQLSQLMSDGRVEGAAERGRRGILPAPAPVGVADAQWMLATMLEGHKIGEVVHPPPGHPTLGGYGLMTLNDSDGASHVVMIKKVHPDEVGSFCDRQITLARLAESIEGEDRSAEDDIRTMAVRYAANGDRSRSFRDSVSEMVEVQMDDFPFEPRTCLSYLQAIQSVAEGCYSHHLAWVQQAKLPEGSRAAFEDETLSQVLDVAVRFDALQICNLASFELLVRRRQLIAEAHSYNPSSPNYEGASYYLGTKFKPGGAIVVPSLTEHVSKKLQADSAILKERRKLEEAKGKGKSKQSPHPKNQGGAGSSQ